MSLINQMLQDLDERRAAHGVGARLPNDVRPLPKAQVSHWPLGVAVGVGLAVVLGAGFVATRDGATQYLASLFPAGAVATPTLVPSATSVVPPAVAPPAPQQAMASPVVEPAVPTAAPETVGEAKRPAVGMDVSLRMADFVEAAAELPAEIAANSGPDSPAPAPADKPGARETKPAVVSSKAAATESPSVAAAKAVDRSPPKPTAKAEEKHGDASDKKRAGAVESAPVIERTPAAGSPHERAENEYRKALAAVNQGRVPEAMDGLREALRQEALHTASRQLLVKLLLEAKNQDEAIAVLQDGLGAQPAQIGWAMSLARLQVDRGELDGAWRTLDYSLPAAGNSPDYLGFAANVLQRLGRYDEAAAQYRKATRLAPADGRWWLGLGWCLDTQGNAAEAREAFLRARQAGNLSPELVSLIDQKLR